MDAGSETAGWDLWDCFQGVSWYRYVSVLKYTLPKTNIAPENRPPELLETTIFRCYVIFQEGTSKNTVYILCICTDIHMCDEFFGSSTGKQH